LAPPDFARKLDLVLKGLSLSRGRLAAELGVSKSLVSRWASGGNAPSGHNLAALTDLIALRRPGFNLHNWEQDLAELAAMFGAAVKPAPTLIAGTKVFDDWIAESKIHKAARASGRLAQGLAGFWRSVVPLINEPGQYVHTHSMMSQVDGSIRVDTLLWGGRATGWAVAGGNQLYTAIGGDEHFGLSFTILNGLDRLSAGVLDGLWLGCLPAKGGMVCAAPTIAARIGDLSGDPARDSAALDALSREPEIVSGDRMPESNVARLAAALPGGAELALILPALTSLARAATSAASPQTAVRQLKVVNR
jgi:transcriptional regulator with XRE-family HTH domain